MIDHRLLHRMQALALGEILDRQHFGPSTWPSSRMQALTGS